MKNKFDNIERQRVRLKVEGYYGVKLQRIRPRQKWFKDERGRNFWIVGGIGEWHGIPTDMMDNEIRSSIEGVLVVAARNTSSMVIYAGALNQLVRGRHKLNRARQSNNDYQFTYQERRGLIQLKQIPDYTLKKIMSFEYEKKHKLEDQKTYEIEKLIAGMSRKERDRLLDSIGTVS